MSRFHQPGADGVRITGHWNDNGNGTPSLSLALDGGQPATDGMSASATGPSHLVDGIAPGKESAEPSTLVALGAAGGADGGADLRERWGAASIAGAVLFHAAIAGVLLWHFSSDNTVRIQKAGTQVMHATVTEDPAVRQAQAEAAAKRQQQAEEARQAEQQRQQEQQRQAEQQRQQAAQKRAQQRQAHQQQVARQQAQARAAEARQAAQARQQAAQQQKAEQARQAQEQAAARAAQQKAAAAKAAAAKRAAESNTPQQLSQVPAATNRVAPNYPRLAQQRGMQGSVTVRFTIRKDGSVDPSSITAVDSTNSMFEKAALDAVRKWRFKPRSRPGIAEVPVRFELSG